MSFLPGMLLGSYEAQSLHEPSCRGASDPRAGQQDCSGLEHLTRGGAHIGLQALS